MINILKCVKVVGCPILKHLNTFMVWNSSWQAVVNCRCGGLSAVRGSVVYWRGLYMTSCLSVNSLSLWSGSWFSGVVLIYVSQIFSTATLLCVNQTLHTHTHTHTQSDPQLSSTEAFDTQTERVRAFIYIQVWTERRLRTLGPDENTGQWD